VIAADHLRADVFILPGQPDNRWDGFFTVQAQQRASPGKAAQTD
jgi:hypothetical protein